MIKESLVISEWLRRKWQFSQPKMSW